MNENNILKDRGENMGARVKISDHLIFFWKNGQLICDNYLTHVQKSMNPSIVPILHLFSEWIDLDSVDQILKEAQLPFSNEQISQIIETLIASKIMVVENTLEHEEEIQTQLWNEWGKAATYFHYHTRTLASLEMVTRKDDYVRLKEKKEQIPRPEIYKTYEAAEKIPLPTPISQCDKSFLEVLLQRQTTRSFEAKATLSKEELATILYYVWGAISCKRNTGNGNLLFKTSPSGGCRHPIEVYPCIFHVQGVPPGIYHYSVKDHALELIKQGDFKELAVKMCAEQQYANQGSAIFFHTARVERSMWKYNVARAYRVIMMDVGHLNQTFSLVAAWLGLGAFYTAALRDEIIEKELELSKDKEIVLGVSGLGVMTPEGKMNGRDTRFINELFLE